MPIRSVVPIAIALAVVADTPAASQTEPTFDFIELAEGVLAALVVPEPPHYAFANSLVVEQDDGLLVVDTQQSPAAAEALIAEIERRWDEPVRWVVNTHWHGDHVYGNIAYRRRWPGVRFLATAATAEAMATQGRDQLAQELADLPESIELRRGWLASGNGPDGRPLTPAERAQVERSVRLRAAQLEQLGSLELVIPDSLITAPTPVGGAVLVPLGPAHTRGDLAVWLPSQRIVAVGDLLEDALPWIEGADITGWADALGTLATLDAEVLLPSHGRPIEGETRVRVQRAGFHAALDAACAEAPGPVPAEVLELAGSVGVEDAAQLSRFWHALVEAARASREARGVRC